MLRYESCGTLRYNLSTKGEDVTECIFFNPHKDYVIKNKGKDYAIFVGFDPSRSLLKEYNSDDRSEIKIYINEKLVGHKSSFSLLAAQSQAEVAIEVEDDGEGKLTLISITIPSK